MAKQTGRVGQQSRVVDIEKWIARIIGNLLNALYFICLLYPADNYLSTLIYNRKQSYFGLNIFREGKSSNFMLNHSIIKAKINHVNIKTAVRQGYAAIYLARESFDLTEYTSYRKKYQFSEFIVNSEGKIKKVV